VNAIEMLEKQHREVEQLFAAFEAAEDEGTQRTAMMEICDALAAHATIEERHFYPAVKVKDTQEELKEAVKEHLEAKKLIAQLIQENISVEQMEAKVKELQGDIEHHVEEEESELFPKVRTLFTSEELEEICVAMENTMADLMAEGEPSKHVPEELGAPASLE
jgi:hemerythrin superfamily protein